ncbi:MAG: nuclear transport factor 2 family protein [Mycobacterium sp.]
MPIRGRYVGIAWLLVAAALITSCTSTTAGRPVAQQTSTATASAPAPTSTTATVPAPAGLVSDEDQVRQAIQAFQDAYNAQDWAAYRALMCPSMHDEFTGPAMAMLKKARAEQGTSRSTVTEVSIDGDHAIVTLDAHNEVLGSRTLTMPLVRSDGWKVCFHA